MAKNLFFYFVSQAVLENVRKKISPAAQWALQLSTVGGTFGTFSVQKYRNGTFGTFGASNCPKNRFSTLSLRPLQKMSKKIFACGAFSWLIKTEHINFASRTVLGFFEWRICNIFGLKLEKPVYLEHLEHQFFGGTFGTFGAVILKTSQMFQLKPPRLQTIMCVVS